MKFGVMVDTSISDWQLLCFAEELGFDSGWVPDSQMIWSDCYAVLALAAHHTTRIRLGTGVAIAGTRTAPVVAHSIATINQLAPGRVHLAIGTGHTAMRVMGFDPVKADAFREYVRVVRALLRGEATDYTWNGETHEIEFLHKTQGFINLENPVPIYVASEGPLGQKTCGAYGDAWLGGRASPGRMPKVLENIRAGAAETARAIPDPFPAAMVASACVLRPGEPIDSDRVIAESGAQVMAGFHMMWENARQQGSDDFVPDPLRDLWDQYCRYLDELGLPADQLRRRVHEGHCTWLQSAERRFVNKRSIRALGGLIGEPDEIIERIRRIEAGGVGEITLLTDAANARRNYEEFARHVIERY